MTTANNNDFNDRKQIMFLSALLTQFAVPTCIDNWPVCVKRTFLSVNVSQHYCIPGEEACKPLVLAQHRPLIVHCCSLPENILITVEFGIVDSICGPIVDLPEYCGPGDSRPSASDGAPGKYHFFWHLYQPLQKQDSAHFARRIKGTFLELGRVCTR